MSARAWLALHLPVLRDRRRMRAVTGALLAVAALAPSVGLAGSSTPPAVAAGANVSRP
ncbi:MAG: hypothetical protein QM679_01030 [Patulibacter sp.]